MECVGYNGSLSSELRTVCGLGTHLNIMGFLDPFT